MIRSVAVCLLLGTVGVQAVDLPSISLASGKWACSKGVSIEDGIASLEGDPKGYVRATFTLPGEIPAGKMLRFSVQVMTHEVQQGQTINYASPKLKAIDEKSKKVLAVNNFGGQERSEWTPVDLDITLPADYEGTITLEIGFQLCSGLFKAKDAAVAAVEPWRWRVLDAGHKSYFDK